MNLIKNKTNNTAILNHIEDNARQTHYLGGYEIYTKTNEAQQATRNKPVWVRMDNGEVEVKRETLHVFNGNKRIATLDSPLEGGQEGVTIRYQYDNHLGSACLELDDHAEIISYEEYHPFGTTSELTFTFYPA